MGFPVEKRVQLLILGPTLLGLWVIADADWPVCSGSAEE
jgi:hypothetical protein